MKKIITTLLVASLIVLAGCTKIATTPKENTTCSIDSGASCEDSIEPDPAKVEEAKPDMTNKEQVIEYALNALKNNSIDQLAEVTSKEGIWFSPYSFLDTDKHIILKKEDFKDAYSWEVKYVWGTEDGSGYPIIMTFKEYVKKYVYDLDFSTLAERNIDKIVQRGNSINNIEDIFTGVSTIEFYVPGINPDYAGMDRRSLTFVLQQEENEWKIKAIVHSQRTI